MLLIYDAFFLSVRLLIFLSDCPYIFVYDLLSVLVSLTLFLFVNVFAPIDSLSLFNWLYQYTCQIREHLESKFL